MIEIKSISKIFNNTFSVVERFILGILAFVMIYWGFKVIKSDQRWLVLALYISYILILACLTFFMRKIIFDKGNSLIRISFLVAAALIIRIFAIYFLGLEQKGDLSVYYITGVSLINGFTERNLYYGVFPHALAYPAFLSTLFKILGQHYWIPRVANLLSSILMVILVYLIVKKISDVVFGFIAALVVSVSPQLILYTNLTSGELLYGTFILAAIFACMNAGSIKIKVSVLWAVGAGLMCGIANFFRPVGLILIIAMIIYFIVICENNLWKFRIACLIGVIIAFGSVYMLTHVYLSHITGYEYPSQNYGWNLYIGANIEHKGQWNEEDAKVFAKAMEMGDPDKIQAYFAEKGFERYRNMGFKIVTHMIDKLKVWLNENYTSGLITGWQYKGTRFYSVSAAPTYSMILFWFNLVTMILAAITMLYSSIRGKISGNARLVMIYAIGSIFIYLIMETHERYKASYYMIFIIIAVYGLYLLKNILAGRFKKESKKIFSSSYESNKYVSLN